jgi:flavin-dependent dehydrogenase
VPISRFGMSPEHPDEFALAGRRLVYESVLRRAVLRQDGVRLLAGRRVTGLMRAEPAGLPVMRGVVTAEDGELRADLVVDATGRRGGLLTRLSDLTLPEPHVQRCGFVYMTRHYRLRPGRELPALDRPLALNLGYGATLAFPGDNGTFSLSVTLATRDPFRQALRRADVWERFIASVPHTARWAATGVPHGGIHVLAGIENRWQRLVGGSGPVVGGLVLLGDVAIQNNPTYGRGVSLAYAKAQRLADSVGEAAGDPVGYVAGFDAWTERNLGVWHRSQTTADAAALALMEAGLRGQPPPPPEDPFSRIMTGIEALSARDPVVARGLARMAHLLITPTQLFADREVMRRVNAFLGSGHVEEPSCDGLPRREFELIAAA